MRRQIEPMAAELLLLRRTLQEIISINADPHLTDDDKRFLISLRTKLLDSLQTGARRWPKA